MDTESCIDLAQVKDMFVKEIKEFSDQKLQGLKKTIEDHFKDAQSLIQNDKFGLFEGLEEL